MNTRDRSPRETVTRHPTRTFLLAARHWTRGQFLFIESFQNALLRKGKFLATAGAGAVIDYYIVEFGPTG